MPNTKNLILCTIRIGYSNGLPLTDQKRTWITNNNWIASRITWAVQNGADILGYDGGDYKSDSIIGTYGVFQTRNMQLVARNSCDMLHF